MLQVLLFGRHRPPLTVADLHRDGFSSLLQGKATSMTWRPISFFSPHLRRAVLASEDQRFLHHHGFDFIELGEALRALIDGSHLRGASTLSMQTARTMFLWPARSWLRKLAEAYYTLLLEFLWSKEKIFEFYLNTVDWGPGLRGGDAAARRYFNCSAAELTPEQAARLAAVLPGPHLWRPDHATEAVVRRTRRILQEMKKMPLVGRRGKNDYQLSMI